MNNYTEYLLIWPCTSTVPQGAQILVVPFLHSPSRHQSEDTNLVSGGVLHKADQRTKDCSCQRPATRENLGWSIYSSILDNQHKEHLEPHGIADVHVLIYHMAFHWLCVTDANLPSVLGLG